MDALKPIRDIWEGPHRNDGLLPWFRLTAARQALGQACVQAFKEDWPKLLAVGVVVEAVVIAITVLG